MGFFKKLFKRKKGGSAVGNWLRRKLYEKTGGLFGASQETIKEKKLQKGDDSIWGVGEGTMSGEVGDWLR